MEDDGHSVSESHQQQQQPQEQPDSLFMRAFRKRDKKLKQKTEQDGPKLGPTALPCSSGVYALLRTLTRRTGCVNLLDAMTGEVLWAADADGVLDYCYCPTANVFVALKPFHGGHIKVWNLNNGAVIQYSHSFSLAEHCTINNSGTQVISWQDKLITCWTIHAEKIECLFRMECRADHCCYPCDDSRVIASDILTQIISVIDAHTGVRLISFAALHTAKIVCGLCETYCGQYTSDEIGVWDFSTGARILNISDRVTALCFANVDTYLVAYSMERLDMTTYRLADGYVMFNVSVTACPGPHVRVGSMLASLHTATIFLDAFHYEGRRVYEFDATTGLEVARSSRTYEDYRAKFCLQTEANILL
jgi:hypothetical protein